MKKILITVALISVITLSLHGKRNKSYNRQPSSDNKTNTNKNSGWGWSSPGLMFHAGGGEGFFSDENHRIRENVNERALLDNMLERISPNSLTTVLIVGSAAYLIGKWAKNKFIVPELEQIENKIEKTSKENNALIAEIQRIRNTENGKLTDADAYSLEIYENICQQCSDVYQTIKKQIEEQINKK